MLSRKTPLKRTGFLKRSKLASMSPRRKIESRIYSAKKKLFLATHPICQHCQTRPSRDLHHKRQRHNGGYLDESSWAALCRTCHDWLHSHPREARAKGWLV